VTLSAGTKLGPYEILEPLGAGGMGEVYKARDARLGREVAIKVLSEKVAGDAAALARFEREARAVAALSHPHILALHDFGQDRGLTYAVMELLDGESLAQRLARGPMPASEIARAGEQICGALSAAHRKGIVHRDLKPANVMLTKSGVKLLDFGLAKAASDAPEGLTAEQTAAADVTREGTIVGTLAYMSPEQVEGRAADARSDIFALGATLYEMATGRKAFEASSQAGLISAILSGEPPAVSTVQPKAPPALDRIVRGCLAKDPDARWQTAHDVGLQLAGLGDSGTSAASAVRSAAPRRRLRWLPWAVAGACAAVAAMTLLRRPAAPPATPVRFALPPPAEGSYGTTFEAKTVAVSPDGTQIAFIVSPHGVSGARRGISAPDASGARRIWIRRLSEIDSHPVPGTEDGLSLFWSPDGTQLGFFTPGKLKRILLSGGAAIPVCDVPPGSGRAGTWGSTGDILFASVQGPAISRVSAAGGSPVDEIKVSGDELRLNWPWYLPDGKRFLYVARLRDGSGRLMLAEPGKPPRVVAPMVSSVQYAEPGFLVFAKEGALLAQRFDPDGGRLLGSPISIAEHVNYFLSTGHAGFAASPAGTLVYQSHDDVGHLAWFDRSGRELGTIGPPGNYLNVSIAEGGRRVFYDRTRPLLGTFDIWSFDLERGVETPVTTEPETEISAIGLPDGRSIVYSANRGGAPQLYRRDLGTGAEQVLAPARQVFQQAQDVSPDGRTLAYTERATTGNFDIWTLPLDGSSKPTPFLQAPFAKGQVRFSRDGRFLAFVSSESGRSEAYLAPFPGPGERIRLSSDGAYLVAWSPDGRELLYMSDEGRMMSVPVSTSPSLRTGPPAPLFTVSGRRWFGFAPSGDGRRFLAVVPDVSADEQPMTVILNWTAALPR